MTSTPFEAKDFDPSEWEDPEPRRGRGFLALDVFIVAKQLTDEHYIPPEGKFLTGWNFGKLMMERLGLDKQPSQGAIDAIFRKWDAWGVAVCRRTPFAFVELTVPARVLGLQGYIDEMKHARSLGITPENLADLRAITSG